MNMKQCQQSSTKHTKAT